MTRRPLKPAGGIAGDSSGLTVRRNASAAVRDIEDGLVRAVLDRCERDGTTEGQEYQDACQAFSDRHLCRVIPNPDCVKRSLEGMPNEVYLTMWGPSEFYATGSLRDWDVTDRLGELELPTLILSGRHDESTPAVSGALQRGIAGSQWVVFEDSSHVPHVEEPGRFLEVVSRFLAQVETGR